MLKRAIAVFLAVLFTSALSGCSFVSTNIETVVSPPKMTEEQAAIYKALGDSVQPGSNIDLKYPESGSNRSAIVTRDIDMDGQNEALVFYQNKSQSVANSSGMRICLLDQVAGEWVNVWDTPGAGTDVDKVEFLYDEDTGIIFVIIGFSTENQPQKTFKVYTYKDSPVPAAQGAVRAFTSVYESSYQVLEVYDIDQDKQKEIITVSSSYAENDSIGKAAVPGNVPIKTTANMIKYQNDAFEQVDQIALLGKAAEYNNILVDTTVFGLPALFLDEVLIKSSSTATYATEILVYRDGRLTNLIDNEETGLFQQTMRVQAPACNDINRDGHIEIPRTTLFPGYTEKDEQPLYMTEWYQLTEAGLSLVETTYINYSQGYGFVLPQEWIGKVTAKSVVEKDEVEFFVFDENLENDSRKLLSLKVDNAANLRDGRLSASYFEIKQFGQLLFLARNYHSAQAGLNLTEEQIKSNFVDLYLLGDES